MKHEFQNVCLQSNSVNLLIENGLIKSISNSAEEFTHIITPLSVDPHVHLDKTFTASRCPIHQTGLFGAIEIMREDYVNWSEEDIRTRMQIAIQEAYENGIYALRSHVDWQSTTPNLAWNVLGELIEDWSDRLVIQRSALMSVDLFENLETSRKIAKIVSEQNGVLGCFVYKQKNFSKGLKYIFDAAKHYDLYLDFHVDEGLDADATALDEIIELTKLHQMSGKVLCGHACSLAVRCPTEVEIIANDAARAGLSLVVLPTTNLQLQDNTLGRTPRLRGIAPIHELKSAGIPISFGADNVADPFFRMGSYDAIETLKLACMVAHLNPNDWLSSITENPANALGIDLPKIEIGAPADFILLEGRNWEEALRTDRKTRQVFRSLELKNNGY